MAPLRAGNRASASQGADKIVTGLCAILGGRLIPKNRGRRKCLIFKLQRLNIGEAIHSFCFCRDHNHAIINRNTYLCITIIENGRINAGTAINDVIAIQPPEYIRIRTTLEVFINAAPEGFKGKAGKQSDLVGARIRALIAGRLNGSDQIHTRARGEPDRRHARREFSLGAA